MRQLRHIVPAFGRPHRELPGNRPVPSVKGQRLLRRQAPVLAETRFEVNCGKTPERAVGAARDIPALDDFLQEAGAGAAPPGVSALCRVRE